MLLLLLLRCWCCCLDLLSVLHSFLYLIIFVSKNNNIIHCAEPESVAFWRKSISHFLYLSHSLIKLFLSLSLSLCNDCDLIAFLAISSANRVSIFFSMAQFYYFYLFIYFFYFSCSFFFFEYNQNKISCAVLLLLFCMFFIIIIIILFLGTHCTHFLRHISLYKRWELLPPLFWRHSTFFVYQFIFFVRSRMPKHKTQNPIGIYGSIDVNGTSFIQ